MIERGALERGRSGRERERNVAEEERWRTFHLRAESRRWR